VSLPVWCVKLAASFWAKAGPPPTFPRDLRHAIGAVPLSVISLKGVSVAAVRDWFQRIAIPVPLDEPDRPLRACLVAWRGEGFAFLDLLDDPAEQVFSLAHEVGHFLRDYLQPRETVTERLGSEALDVLDGLRQPTSGERFHAVLRNMSLGPFAHLLRRDDSGRPLTPAEREAEVAADRLAFELLAPVADIGDVTNSVALIERLMTVFGLPPEPAARYAAILLPAAPSLDRALTRLIIS
jgi:hypothetical protein